MGKSGGSASQDSSSFRERVEQLFRASGSGPPSSFLAEVECLVYGLEADRIALERRSDELRTTLHQLEMWRKRYADLHEFVPLGLVTLDQAGRMREANCAACRLLRTERSLLLGRPFGGYVASDDMWKFKNHLRECLTGSTGASCELMLSFEGCEALWVRLHGGPARDPGTGAPVYRVALIDLTEREELAQRLSDSSMCEQRRIGQELHDSLGQELTGLGYLTERLYRQLEAKGLAEAAAADDLADGIRRCLECVHALSRGLVPVDIDPRGLTPALAELASDVERHFGIDCRFRCEHPVEARDNHTATHLVSIAKEAVTNAIKHAKAEHLVISLQADRDGVMLQVRDDGKGISRHSGQAGGVGLHIMRHRASAIGASLEVRPSEGGGTVITCISPVEDCHETTQHEREPRDETPNPHRG